MFCKNCGKQFEDGTKFCPECGTAQDASANAAESAKEENANSHSDSLGKTAADDAVSKRTDGTPIIENTNPLCIAGLVLTVLMLFFNSYGIVGFAAIVLSFLGYKAAKKNGQKGTMLAIVCMAVAGIVSLIFVIRLIEYNRYESAVYGGINGFFDWLSDL